MPGRSRASCSVSGSDRSSTRPRITGAWPFFDKDTLPLKRFDAGSGVRIGAGGSTVRDGAYLGRGVVCMPPMDMNIGVYVGDETLVDSHALVGARRSAAASTSAPPRRLAASSSRSARSRW